MLNRYLWLKRWNQTKHKVQEETVQLESIGCWLDFPRIEVDEHFVLSLGANVNNNKCRNSICLYRTGGQGLQRDSLRVCIAPIWINDALTSRYPLEYCWLVGTYLISLACSTEMMLFKNQ